MTAEEQFAEIRSTLSTLSKLHLDSEQKAEEWREQWEERAAAAEERAIAAEERHDREMADIRAKISQAVLLSIREARAERSKRRELDARLDTLTANVQRLLDTRHGNGKP